MRTLVTQRWAVATVLSAGLALAACSAPAALTQPSWAAPADPMALATQAGLGPTVKEYLLTHTHAHLDVMVDGKHVVVPAGIGIDIHSSTGIDEKPTLDGTATEYYVTLCTAPCLSPLHTHDPSGILHTESKDANHAPDTLGQFFVEWGVRLDDSCVGEFCKPDTSIAVYLDGVKHDGNPADIQLKSHLEIAIIIGKPPTIIPDLWDFGELP